MPTTMLYVELLSFSMTLLAVVTFMLSIDDIIIDLCYWINKLYQKCTTKKHSSSLPTLQQIKALPEQSIAIMIPAWQEQDVIAKMIQHVCSNIDYGHYHIFIGTYPNDTDTLYEVERIQKHFPQVHHVEVPHHGPTNKADCLNAIYSHIQHAEEQQQFTFAGYVLHDCEDVLHPLELKLFNALLQQYDLIQLPVRAIECPLSSFISGTYIDEFAEWHTKDILIRALLTHIVPSAGVGTCFSQKALNTATQQNTQPPFNTQCVTEDYEVSLRVGLQGLPTLFALFNVPYPAQKGTNEAGSGAQTGTRPLAVQEYFPDTLKTAYKQKARWILGIGFQGWQLLGWTGTLLNRYFLYRDRKSLLTPMINMGAYLMLLQIVLVSIAAPTLFMRYLDTLTPWVQHLYLMLSLILCFRLVQRAYFVTRLYGWRHGLMVFPRTIINNIINFLAVSRAWRLFFSHTLYKTPVVWDKTTHRYPDTNQATKNTSLPYLLRQHHLLSDAEINDIPLSVQQKNDLFIHYLIQEKKIAQDKLYELIAYQCGLPFAYIKENEVKQIRSVLPKEAYQLPYVIPFRIKDNNCLCLATSEQLSSSMLNYFSDITGCSVEQYIAPLNQIISVRKTLTADEEMENK